MLTQSVWKLLGSFSALFFTGMIFGNIPLICFSLIPLIASVFSLYFEEPREIRVERGENKISAWVNETIEMKINIEAPKGIGIITVADTLPEHFELKGGNNFHVFWKGFRKLSKTLNYKVKCTKRGIYHIGPTCVESRHFSGLRQTRIDEYPMDAELVVRPRPLGVKRIRDPKILSKIPMPIAAVTKLGMLTTDFREIRHYCWGDPYRQINWKATARLTNNPRSPPFINDFEREGKRVIWIFLDASPYMRIGTTTENAFEYAVQAVLGLTQFYLARNCYVALYAYNDGGRSLLPDCGRRQEYKVSREILTIEPKTEAPLESLEKAAKKCQGHIKGANPYFIIVTMVKEDNVQELLSGIRQLRKFSKGSRRKPQILIIHVSGYSITARELYENAAATMLEIKNNSIIKLLRRSGAYVIPWNPRRRSFSRLLLAGLTQK
jgi:uncharacterized protein (DUF58 family)